MVFLIHLKFYFIEILSILGLLFFADDKKSIHNARCGTYHAALQGLVWSSLLLYATGLGITAGKVLFENLGD